MKASRAKTLLLALWLGIAAIAASTFEQHQLAMATLSAAGVSARSAFAIPPDYHMMPDGTVMAGTMHGAAKTSPSNPDDGQRSSDSGVSVGIAAISVFTPPIGLILFNPDQEAKVLASFAANSVLRAHYYSAYASRGPPDLVIG